MAQSKVTIKLDLSKLDQKITGVLKDVAVDLGPELQNQFNQSVYSWKGPDFFTKRKNGQTVSEPRDIVDTGALRDSQAWRIADKRALIFSWGGGFITYAGAVFFGLPYNGANGPGRDWIKPVLPAYGFAKKFAEFWRSRSAQ